MKFYNHRYVWMTTHVFCLFVLTTLMTACQAPADTDPRLTFEITVPAEAHPEPITGRVYVMISRQGEREPRLQIRRATGIPLWGENVYSLKSGEAGIIDAKSFGFPLRSIQEIPPGEYFVQGFVNIYTEFQRSDGHTLWFHQDQWEGQQWNLSPGNLYSDVKKMSIDPSNTQTIRLNCTNVIPPIDIPADTRWVKRIKFQSDILTEFWGQPMYLGATVLLPKGYDDHPDVHYPVNYVQGHFSLRPPHGFRTDDPGEENRWGRRGYDFYKYWTSDQCPRMIAVTFQHPCPYYDDSYGVNSPNTGPYGDAIMEELIPRIEEQFRVIRKPYARVLSGGSTGGWICLAFQTFYPDFFSGTWSLCPDPVDFRYYQIVNIYEDKNAYYQELEWMRVERPNLRSTDGNIQFMMKDENYYELVVGDKTRGGGQWDIWEAVFSPIGQDGYPKPIWDKVTGEIDHRIAQEWKKYDLRYYLEQNWSWLGPKLAGKLHIYTGSMDSFYLNDAVVLLEAFLENTTEPYYAGTVEYGDRQPHCWGPRGEELFGLFRNHIVKNADPGDDTSAWNY